MRGRKWMKKREKSEKKQGKKVKRGWNDPHYQGQSSIRIERAFSSKRIERAFSSKFKTKQIK